MIGNSDTPSREGRGALTQLVVVALGVLLAPGLTSQARLGAHGFQPPPTRALGSDDSAQDAVLTLAGEMDLRRLVDLTASHLSVRLDYDPGQVAGNVTIRSPKPVTNRELWDLLNQILISRGLTTIRTDDSAGVSVVRLQEAAQQARIEPDAEAALLDTWQPDSPRVSFVSVMVGIQNGSRADVLKAIQPVLSKPGGAAIPIGENTVRLSDLRSRVAHTLQIVESMQVPSTVVSIDRYEVQSLPAADLVSHTTELVSRLTAAGDPPLAGSLLATPDGAGILVLATAESSERWLDLLRRLDTREPIIARTYVVRWHSLTDVASLIESTLKDAHEDIDNDGRASMSIDSLSGALIVRATSRVHAEVQALMDRLDQMPGQARRPMRTYAIRNRGAGEVLALLNSLIAESAGADHTPGSSTATDLSIGTTNGNFSSTEIARDGSRLRADTGTLETASSGLVMTVDDSTNTLIAIGEPRQLEHIEALLPTLDRRQAQVGLEVLILSLTEGDTLDLGAELEYITKQQSTTIALASLFGLSSGSNAARTSAGIGGTALILDPGDFAVVIRALETISKGRSLSMPRLLAGNNKPATINSVLQQPFTSTNASDTVATTSFGGTQDAGTNVTITPTIAAGDHLVLEYQISISAFVGESATPGVPPARQQNSVSGSVTIPDGHTVAIGGLKLTTDAKSTSQIPLLGDLPLLGEAFKNRSNSGSESRFYVFIRANVLRHSSFEDLKLMSVKELGDAGLADGFPVVEPRVIR